METKFKDGQELMLHIDKLLRDNKDILLKQVEFLFLSSIPAEGDKKSQLTILATTRRLELFSSMLLAGAINNELIRWGFGEVVKEMSDYLESQVHGKTKTDIHEDQVPPRSNSDP